MGEYLHIALGLRGNGEGMHVNEPWYHHANHRQTTYRGSRLQVAGTAVAGFAYDRTEGTHGGCDGDGSLHSTLKSARGQNQPCAMDENLHISLSFMCVIKPVSSGGGMHVASYGSIMQTTTKPCMVGSGCQWLGTVVGVCI